MTSHRLIHCTVTDLVAAAAQRYTLLGDDQAIPVPRWWAAHNPRDAASVAWHCTNHSTRPARGRLAWRLDVEPGATGVLAHLAAATAPARPWPVPTVVIRVLLAAWARHELAMLAQSAELAPLRPDGIEVRPDRQGG